MQSCEMCKTNVITNAIWCKICNGAVYCSDNCQTRHTVVHQRKCSVNKNVGWGPDSVIMRLNKGLSRLSGVVKPGDKKLPPNSIGGVLQDWTSDLPRNAALYERAYERFIDSYRLSVEDARVHGKEDPAADVNALNDFINYFKMAKKHKVLPTWWNAQCDKQLLVIAKKSVNIPAKKSQLAKEHGAFEPVILRMMAEKIHGTPLQLKA